MFKPIQEHVDLKSGMHVIRLQNDEGHEHLVQIFIGHSSCPACGALTHSEGREIDPKSAIQAVIDNLETSRAAMRAYAEKHGVPVR